jgi:hypothetical protein
MSRTRTNSSGVPAKKNRMPGVSRATNDSSTEPSTPPRRYCTTICASLTIVPIDMRCRRACSRSVSTNRPFSRSRRAYSGYDRSDSPPEPTNSSAQSHSASVSSA